MVLLVLPVVLAGQAPATHQLKAIDPHSTQTYRPAPCA
jgi:hypothetical protein